MSGREQTKLEAEFPNVIALTPKEQAAWNVCLALQHKRVWLHEDP